MRIAGFIDHTHTALAEFGFDAVVGERNADHGGPSRIILKIGEAGVNAKKHPNPHYDLNRAPASALIPCQPLPPVLPRTAAAETTARNCRRWGLDNYCNPRYYYYGL